MQDHLHLDEIFTEEEQLIRDSVRRYVDDQVIPKMPTAFDKAEFPKEFISDCAKLGLYGMTLPKQFGGSEASALAYGLVCQELERGDSGLRSLVSVQSSLCMYPIFRYGSEAQRQHYLPKMAAGEVIGCFGLTEPDVGSNPAEMKTTAKKVKDGWLLNGSKLWITNAGIADLAIVWAKTEQGICGFIIEKNAVGFTQQTMHQKVPFRASITGELILQDCLIADDCLLPGSECGLKAPLSCLSQARYGIAWGVIGAAEYCFDIALDYVKERQQFNKPIASFQLIQNDLANMATELTQMKALNLRLGQLKSQDSLSPAMISMAKMQACRTALNVARNARNLLGANGISLDYHIIRHLNNLEAVFTYEGTDNIHHLVLGQYLTGINAFGG